MSVVDTKDNNNKVRTVPSGVLEALAKQSINSLNEIKNVKPITNKEKETVELNLQPYEWASGDRDGHFSIRTWTNTRKTETKDSERVLIRIEDYEPFCRLELPSVVGGKTVKWNVDALQVYTQWLRNALKHHAPTRIIYKDMFKIYWHKVDESYQKIKYPFLTCYFQTEEAMRHCIQLINKQGYNIDQLGFIKSRIWESSITSIHRLVTDIGVGYAQWFKVQAQKVPELDKISSNPLEYIASYKNIHPLKPEETQGWITNPLMAAIDIETYSHIHRAMPNPNYAEDVVFQVSYILQRLGDPKSRKKYLLALGPCADIPGAEVLRFKHEIQLIDGLCELISKTDPTLLLGYNIFKFDFPYMDNRMKLYMREWRACGLIKDQTSFINSRTWKSSAYGFMNISTLEAEGRLCIDMYPIIKRDHKLDRYTLDFVSKHFLNGRGKHDVSPRQMFETFKECNEAEVSADPGRIQTAAEKMATVGAYCLEDSVLCIDLLEKLNVWIMLVELSIIVMVTVMSIFTRGQQIRVQNQVYQFAYREDFVIDERSGARGAMAGGSVDEPIPGKYKNLLIFDFASLYPSIIRAFNICYTTLVPPESDIPDSMCNVLAWTETDSKTGEIKYHRHRFIKKEYFHGILPRICENLTNERQKTRDLINPKNDPIVNTVLNQRQLGLKISNNSIFGSMSVTEGRLPLPEGGESVTATGRQLKGMAADHVRTKHKGLIVYGDTDSIMVDKKIEDPHKVIEEGEALAAEFKTIFPPPLELTFERGLAIGFFIKKKKYAGVPLAIVKLKDGDIIERINFDPEYDDPKLALYKFTLVRDGKAQFKYVGVPVGIPIAGRNIAIGDRVDVISVPKDTPLAKYRITKGSEILEIDGRKVIAGIPLDAKIIPLKVGHKIRIVRYTNVPFYEVNMSNNANYLVEGNKFLLNSLQYPLDIGDTLEICDDFIEHDNTHSYVYKINQIRNDLNITYKVKGKNILSNPQDHHFNIGDVITILQNHTDPTIFVSELTQLSNSITISHQININNRFSSLQYPLDINDTLEVIKSIPQTNNRPDIYVYKLTQNRNGQFVSYEVFGDILEIKVPMNMGGQPNTSELMKKGIVLARRDNCIWLREAYQRVLLSILFDKSMQYTLDIVNEEIMKMMTFKIPFQKMMVTREIGSNYKPNSTYPLKLFADELRRQGHIIQGGERIDYVFVRCQEQWRNEKQGLKMRLPEMFWTNCENEPLDRLHYVEKIFQNPVEQILYIGYKDQIDAIEQRFTPATKRRGKIYTYISHKYVNTWVKLIKAKEDLTTMIKTYKPHFTSHDPYFSHTFMDQPTVTLQVIN